MGKILDIILVFFVALAARDTSILSDLAHRSPTSSSLKDDDDHNGHGSFVDCLFQLLEIVISQHDPLLLVSSKSDIGSGLMKKAGISKRDFETVCSWYLKYASHTHPTIGKDYPSNHTLEIPFIPSGYPGRLIHNHFIIVAQIYCRVQISTPLLIMYSLHSLSPSDISTSHLPTLLASLRLSLEVAGPTTSLISALHLRWRDVANALSYEIIYYHLQMLEAYLSNQWESLQSRSSQGQEETNENAMEVARDEWLVDDLIALGVCIELELQTQDPIPSKSVS